MPTTIAIYPGTFDPVTNGHLDVIRRGSRLFGQLVVACAVNIAKQPLFSLDERLGLLRSVTRNIKNVRVEAFEGMVVDYVKKQGARVILRGIRTFSDFESEVQMALANRTFAPEIETVFVCASLEESFISSRLIREAAALDGDVGRFVPPQTLQALKGKAKALHAQVGNHGKGRRR
jgi:pantetheine-phosphate adenylyltransferase